MDPVTHTLVGASLAATRLGERTRFAWPALIVGANLPDLDVLAYAAGGDAALGFRRGWTHGVPALLVLPALLAACLWLIGRHRRPRPEVPAVSAGRPEVPAVSAGRPEVPAVSAGWLVALCYLAVVTHPVLDWLNTYGMRWWMPIRGDWSYGDAVFIMDPWLWLILGAGFLLGRRAAPGPVAAWALASGLLLAVVAGRSSEHLPAVVAVAIALLAALLWRPSGRSTRRRAAAAGLTIAVLYAAGMVTLHGLTESRVLRELGHSALGAPERWMVGPMPADPFTWDVVAQHGGEYRFGRFAWRGGGRLTLEERGRPVATGDPVWQRVLASGQAQGFLTWVRFPWLETEPDGQGGLRVHLMDARYARQRRRGFGATLVRLPGPEPAP